MARNMLRDGRLQAWPNGCLVLDPIRITRIGRQLSDNFCFDVVSLKQSGSTAEVLEFNEHLGVNTSILAVQQLRSRGNAIHINRRRLSTYQNGSLALHFSE